MRFWLVATMILGVTSCGSNKVTAPSDGNRRDGLGDAGETESDVAAGGDVGVSSDGAGSSDTDASDGVAQADGANDLDAANDSAASSDDAPRESASAPDSAPDSALDSSRDGPCDVGCKPTTQGPFCHAGEVQWLCQGSGRDVVLFETNCRAAPTDSIRYCCAPSFLSMCQ
jgi:hypothetical protein